MAECIWVAFAGEVANLRSRLNFVTCGLAATLCAAVVATDGEAADTLPCVTAYEENAFDLRHLQSRFMVAALACNQRDAYNKFVTRFRPLLLDAGGRLISYFKRAGGGRVAVNTHVTDLADAAGPWRAENPASYCAKAWNLFWSLEQAPLSLAKIAATDTIGTVARSPVCMAAVSVNDDRAGYWLVPKRHRGNRYWRPLEHPRS